MPAKNRMFAILGLESVLGKVMLLALQSSVVEPQVLVFVCLTRLQISVICQRLAVENGDQYKRQVEYQGSHHPYGDPD